MTPDQHMQKAREVLKAADAAYVAAWEQKAADEDAARVIATALSQAYQSGVEAERERAAQIADRWEGKPCRPAAGWSAAEAEGYDNGQVDASTSIAAAIRKP